MKEIGVHRGYDVISMFIYNNNNIQCNGNIENTNKCLNKVLTYYSYF